MLTLTDIRALDAAAITDPGLRNSYAHCRRLHAKYGRTYYLATLLLPRWKRPYVHALYGFARFADEIVDNGDPASREAKFTAWSSQIITQLAGGGTGDRVCTALAHTMRTWDIPLKHVQAFLAAMRADLTTTGYARYTDLAGYMYGSAAVIGLQMTPILEPTCHEAYERAKALGEAFQLSNFIRDIGEDLLRGRVYLPQEDLDAFGITREHLAAPHTSRPVRELLRFEIDRTRKLYAYAAGGFRMLHPSSRPCIETAYTLYSGILDAVEDAEYDILHRRVSVSLRARIKVVAPAYRRARRQRLTAANPR